MVGMYFKKWRFFVIGLVLSGVSVGIFVIFIFLEVFLETFFFYGVILVISVLYFNGCVSVVFYRFFLFYIKCVEKKNLLDFKNEFLFQEELIVKELIEQFEIEKIQIEFEKNIEYFYVESEEEVKKSFLELNQIEDITSK